MKKRKHLVLAVLMVLAQLTASAPEKEAKAYNYYGIALNAGEELELREVWIGAPEGSRSVTLTFPGIDYTAIFKESDLWGSLEYDENGVATLQHDSMGDLEEDGYCITLEPQENTVQDYGGNVIRHESGDGVYEYEVCFTASLQVVFDMSGSEDVLQTITMPSAYPEETVAEYDAAWETYMFPGYSFPVPEDSAEEPEITWSFQAGGADLGNHAPIYQEDRYVEEDGSSNMRGYTFYHLSSCLKWLDIDGNPEDSSVSHDPVYFTLHQTEGETNLAAQPLADGTAVAFWNYSDLENAAMEEGEDFVTWMKRFYVQETDAGQADLTPEGYRKTEEELLVVNQRIGARASVSAVTELVVEEGASAKDITGKYTIRIEAVNGGALPAETSYTNPEEDGGTVTFSGIVFSSAGDYTYRITETGDVEGVTNEENRSKTVTIHVTENEDGSLSVDHPNPSVTFVHTIQAPEPVSTSIRTETILNVEEGASGKDISGKYTMTITAPDGAPLPQEVSAVNPDPDGGAAVFEGITFSQAGTYTYTITETGDVEGVTNEEPRVQTVTISVVQNADGTLSIVNPNPSVTFTHEIHATESVENPGTGAGMPLEGMMALLGAGWIGMMELGKRKRRK